MSRFWSPVVREIEPYVPGEQPQIDGLIKLNTNENPYPPSRRVAEVLNADEIDRLKLYPDPNATILRCTLATYYNVPESWVFVGNGSDEVLAQIFMAFFQQGKPVQFPDITYSFYDVYCQLFGVEKSIVPLREDLSLALDDFASPNGGIIFPNPNAPTGSGVSTAEIAGLAGRNTDSVIVVDEAYIDFGGQTAISLTSRFENLLVVQTLSKSRSLAGLRVGFAIGQPTLIEGLERVKNSFNSYPLDRLAQLAAVAAIEDDTYFKDCCQRVIATRERTTRELEQLGFRVLPSAANFVFAKPPEGMAADAFALQLREHKVLVRYFNKPRISDYLRITIGTDEQMQTLLAVTRELLA